MTATPTLRPAAPPSRATRSGRAARSGPHRALPSVVLVGVVAVLVVAAASLLVGSAWVPPRALVDPGAAQHAVAQARVDRTLLGLAVGGALGLVGALMQGLTRNPLADPGILGVNAGAALAMVLAIATLGVTSLTAYVWFGFGGAALALVLVHGLAALGREGLTPVKVAIAGAAISAAALSWTQATLLTAGRTAESFRLWQVGTVGGRDAHLLLLGLPFLAAGAVLGLGSARRLNALALGDDLARGLGRHVLRDRLVVGLAVVLLAGTSTALAGPIAFAGLLVPHAVRAVVGPDYRRVLPLSVLAGATLIVTADVLGRVVLPPSEVQAGIMTAVVGVPAFLWLVRRGRAVAL